MEVRVLSPAHRTDILYCMERTHSFYLWMMIVFGCPGTILVLIASEVDMYSLPAFFGEILSNGTLLALGVVALISAVPAFLSSLPSPLRHYLGFGVPFLIALPTLVHNYTCTEKFCNFIDMAIVLGSFIFCLFYVLCLYLRKWNVRIVRVLMLLTIAITVLTALYITLTLLLS
jgi:hypothetical protein